MVLSQGAVTILYTTRLRRASKGWIPHQRALENIDMGIVGLLYKLADLSCKRACQAQMLDPRWDVEVDLSRHQTLIANGEKHRIFFSYFRHVEVVTSACSLAKFEMAWCKPGRSEMSQAETGRDFCSPVGD